MFTINVSAVFLSAPKTIALPIRAARSTHERSPRSAAVNLWQSWIFVLTACYREGTESGVLSQGLLKKGGPNLAGIGS